MVTIKTFKALRPKNNELASRIAAYPYDVVNSDEAREIAKDNPHSFFHISKSEIDLPASVNLYDAQVYATAKSNLQKFTEQGWLFDDADAALYIYRQIMGNHTQMGVVAACSLDDYDNDIIKKHEKTRQDKEDDRTTHILETGTNNGLGFLTFRDQVGINDLMQEWVHGHEPIYDFTASDQIRHTVWKINLAEENQKIIDAFKKVPFSYIADGHHRSKASSRARTLKRSQNANHTGLEEYNYYLAVLFPDTQLKILPYNRVVKSKNAFNLDQLLSQLGEHFEISPTDIGTPNATKNFCMYAAGKWYALKAKISSYNPSDVISRLDVAILQDKVLDPLFGIVDPRTSKDVDFIGGIRGDAELKKLVDSGNYQVAFSLYPCSVDDLMSIADAGEIMPPKSTWFEPKLRSGLLVRRI